MIAQEHKAPCKLVMQGDGNLVLYGKDNSAVWSTNTHKRANGPYNFVMQEDGNLVLYAEGNRVLWASNTAGK